MTKLRSIKVHTNKFQTSLLINLRPNEKREKQNTLILHRSEEQVLSSNQVTLTFNAAGHLQLRIIKKPKSTIYRV